MSIQHARFGGNPMPKDYLAAWEQWMRAAGRSPQTVRTRLAGMRTLCRHAGVTSVTAVTADQVAAWLADCSKPWTRATYYMTVRCWAAWALAEGVICADPTARLAKPRTPKCVPRPVSDAVIRQLLNGQSEVPATRRSAGTSPHGRSRDGNEHLTRTATLPRVRVYVTSGRTPPPTSSATRSGRRCCGRRGICGSPKSCCGTLRRRRPRSTRRSRTGTRSTRSARSDGWRERALSPGHRSTCG